MLSPKGTVIKFEKTEIVPPAKFADLLGFAFGSRYHTGINVTVDLAWLKFSHRAHMLILVRFLLERSAFGCCFLVRFELLSFGYFGIVGTLLAAFVFLMVLFDQKLVVLV